MQIFFKSTKYLKKTQYYIEMIILSGTFKSKFFSALHSSQKNGDLGQILKKSPLWKKKSKHVWWLKNGINVALFSSDQNKKQKSLWKNYKYKLLIPKLYIY